MATNALVWLATRKVWTGRGDWPVRRLPTPETRRMVAPSSSTLPMAPGAPVATTPSSRR